MSKRRGILCAGCWTHDNIRIIDRWPEQETLSTTLRTDRQGGGSAHNVSIGLKKLDPSFPVYTAGLIGNDSAGDFLYEQALKAGVDVQQLHRHTSASTSFTDVMSVESTGKRTFFHHAGANDLLTPDHIDFTQCSAVYLHLGLLGVHKLLDAPCNEDENGWVTILKRARAHDIHTNIEMVSIDAQTNRQLALPCLAHLDSLIVNDYEAGCLAKMETVHNGLVSEKVCIKAAQKLLTLGDMQFVIVHFPSGAAVASRDGMLELIPSATVPPEFVKSTVGAGDAFSAGVLYGLASEYSLEKSIVTGHAVAAASLRSETTVGSVESLSACLEFSANCK